MSAAAILQTCISPAVAVVESKVADPYLGAIVMDADTGQIYFEDRSNTKGYPASVLKLMVLLIVLEKIDSGAMHLDDQITVTAEASTIGGSQVYLKEHEVFTVDDLLYALMVQSANDAAAALAIHAAGSKEAFVELMNARAVRLGMKSTEFHSIHGLPPGKDQLPDISTARDLAYLARELLKRPDTLKYTSCRERGFRNNTYTMRTHNHLLSAFPGCDGLKTGYFRKAGFSIAATAKRGSGRVIAVVMGSPSRKTRDTKAMELLTKGLAAQAAARAVEIVPTNAPLPEAPQSQEEQTPRRGRAVILAVSLALLVAAAAVCGWIFFYRPKDEDLVERH